MAKNYFNRYVWLIDTINRAGHISLKDLSTKWERSPMNDDGERLAERTFHNHRIAIEDTFGIEIKCDRSLGYYISNEDDIESGAIRQWMLESLSLSNMLNETRDMRDRILFEEIPSGKKWLSVIVNAMRDGKAVEMTYHSFWSDEVSTFIAHPWCLKLFKQRWYVLAYSEKRGEPRIYSLDDRMLAITPTGKALRIPSKFNAREDFRNYFGIIVGEDYEPEVIRLRVDADQVSYFNSLPLHPSQKLVESNAENSVFEYYLAPTFDFKQEILRHGPAVEVLAPESFREEVIEDVRATLSLYGGK
jgi:predicted DNA-binding transcriptional regulator YafY